MRFENKVILKYLTDKDLTPNNLQTQDESPKTKRTKHDVSETPKAENSEEN